MRVTWRGILAVMVLAGVSLAGAKSVAAQDDQFLMPEQSAAKAKEILAAGRSRRWAGTPI